MRRTVASLAGHAAREREEDVHQKSYSSEQEAVADFNGNPRSVANPVPLSQAAIRAIY